MAARIPGPVFKAVISRGKTGYDYDSLAGCVYVDSDCCVYPVRQLSDGEIYYVKEHGEVIHFGLGCCQVIPEEELRELVKRYEQSRL